MVGLAAFLYVLLTTAAYYFARRYAALRRPYRLAFTFTVAPAVIAGGVLCMALADACFDLSSVMDAAEETDAAIAGSYPLVTALLSFTDVPTEVTPFVAVLLFAPGAVAGCFGWYRVFRVLDRASPEERAALAQAIADRAEEDREVERRLAQHRAELDATIRGPRGTECPRCRKKLTFLNRAHGENLRICAACYRDLAHLGSAGPVRARIREEVRAEAARRTRPSASRPTHSGV